jgi:nucleoside-diphosphate-sugar epimerase
MVQDERRTRKGSMNIPVTGAAGFVGVAVAHRLLDRGDEVVGINNLNDYLPICDARCRKPSGVHRRPWAAKLKRV